MRPGEGERRNKADCRIGPEPDYTDDGIVRSGVGYLTVSLSLPLHRLPNQLGTTGNVKHPRGACVICD